MPTSLIIPIPAGTGASQCSSCRQTIFWAPHPSTGKKHPVSIECGFGRAPSNVADGRGVSHFSDCPNANDHRKPRPPQGVH